MINESLEDVWATLKPKASWIIRENEAVGLVEVGFFTWGT